MTLRRTLLLATLGPVARADPAPVLRTESGRALWDEGAPLHYLDFWASWCAPCRLSFPWLKQLHTSLAPAGLRIVAVNLERQRASADAFLRSQGPLPFELAFDPEARSAEALRLPALPCALLVDAQGQRLWTHQGFRRGDGERLQQRMAQALRERT